MPEKAEDPAQNEPVADQTANSPSEPNTEGSPGEPNTDPSPNPGVLLLTTMRKRRAQKARRKPAQRRTRWLPSTRT